MHQSTNPKPTKQLRTRKSRKTDNSDTGDATPADEAVPLENDHFCRQEEPAPHLTRQGISIWCTGGLQSFIASVFFAPLLWFARPPQLRFPLLGLGF
jgi:hypothetical protein